MSFSIKRSDLMKAKHIVSKPPSFDNTLMIDLAFSVSKTQLASVTTESS